MICSCPKCHNDIDVALDQVPDQGASRTCPECNGRFWVSMEPFALRAVKKEGKIYCVACDRELGVLNFCQGCSTPFPNYWVVQTSKPVRRKAERRSFSINLIPERRKRVRVAAPAAASVPAGEGLGRPFLLRAGVAALVLLLVVAGGLLYLNAKREQEYTQNFAVAIYGIKTGTDRSMKNCSAMAGGGQSGSRSGGTFSLAVSTKEEADLKKIKSEIDKVMAKLASPPQKFAESNEKLTRLYTFYTQLHALNLSPPGNPAELANSASRIEGNFDRTARELKASLPENLAEELRKAGTKYKNLKFMIES